MQGVERAMVVEDDRSLLRTLRAALSERFADVRCCRTVAEAEELVRDWRPELLLVDFQLPDGDARAILDLTALRQPAPVIVAVSGEAGPIDSFELAQRGVRAFLAKPLTLDALDRAIEAALSNPPPLEPIVRQAVGHVGLAAVTEQIRDVMIDEALARSAGNRRAAARMLRSSRQLLQYLIRRR